MISLQYGYNQNDLRPSHVYGKGENGETAKKAKEYYERIKDIWNRISKEKGIQKLSKAVLLAEPRKATRVVKTLKIFNAK